MAQSGEMMEFTYDRYRNEADMRARVAAEVYKCRCRVCVGEDGGRDPMDRTWKEWYDAYWLCTTMARGNACKCNAVMAYKNEMARRRMVLSK